MRDHRLIDKRSLAFGREIAARLQEHPEWIDRARKNISRWLKTCSSREQSTLNEWQAVLNGPPRHIVELLTDPGENATRLRQSNPFAGVLAEKQRLAILREFQAYDAEST
jgi:hypothetical protein